VRAEDVDALEVELRRVDPDFAIGVVHRDRQNFPPMGV
jgi:hypothetical protein